MASDRTLAERFRAEAGQVIGGDDAATVAEAWTGGRSAGDLVVDCVETLDPLTRTAFLAAWEEPWDLVLVTQTGPHLEALGRWIDGVGDEDGIVLLLVSPAGPPPPAVFALGAPSS